MSPSGNNPIRRQNQFPQLPATHTLHSDAAVKNYLSRVGEILNILMGNTGTGLDRLLTVRDLVGFTEGDPIQVSPVTTQARRIIRVSGDIVRTGKIESNDSLTAFDLDSDILYFNGKDEFGSTKPGIFLGKHKDIYKLDIGHPAVEHGIHWDGVDLYWEGVNTSLSKAGVFTASQAVITGSITATSGVIGGFTIDPTAGLYAGTGATRVQMQPGGGIWLGATVLADAPFSVTNAGVLKAASGTIGGWTVDATKISHAGIELDSDQNRIRAFTGDNYVDITAGGLTGYDSVLGTVFRLYTDGSAPEFSSGVIKEVEFQVYTSGVIKTAADPTATGGLVINNTSMRGYSNAPLKVLEFIYDGTDQGDAYIGDYDNGNAGLFYDHSAGTLTVRGTVVIESLDQQPADDDLVGYWPLNDGAGSVAVDASGNGNDGTLEGSMTDADWVLGKSGLCLDFDGSDDRVDLGNGAPISTFMNGDFSVSIWVKSNNTPSGVERPLYKYQDANNYFGIGAFGTSMSFDICKAGTGAGLLFPNNPWDGDWHHLVAVIDRTADTGKLWMDGEELTFNSWDFSTFAADLSNTGNLSIGAQADGSSPFDGKVDEVRVYDKALSASEIRALYLYPAGNAPAALAGPQTPWAHSSDATKIDGGNVYTGTITATQISANTITANEIKGTGFGTLTISSGGKIQISTTDALEITSAGNVKVLKGGDIIMDSEDASNVSRIVFTDTVGGGDDVEIKYNYDYDGLEISGNSFTAYLGGTSSMIHCDEDTFRIRSGAGTYDYTEILGNTVTHQLILSSLASSSDYHAITIDNEYIEFSGDAGGTGEIRLFAINEIYPSTTRGTDLGKSDKLFDKAYIYDLSVAHELSLNGTTINEISTDGTLAGNSDDAVPTEKAVKTYVDTIIAGL